MTFQDVLARWLVDNGLAEEQSGYGHVSGDDLAERLCETFNMGWKDMQHGLRYINEIKARKRECSVCGLYQSTHPNSVCKKFELSWTDVT